MIDIFIHIAHAATEAATHAAPEVTAAASHTAEAAGSTGVAELFGLNWKLFIAQLINFSIILLVMWRFVFRPVSKALAERTTKIENSLAEAERITADRETFDSWKNKEISGVRQEAAEIITQAKGDAERVRSEITETAKTDATKIMERGKVQLNEEKDKAVQEIKAEIADMVVKATETILKKKMDSASDQALIKEAIESLKNKPQ